MAEETLQKDLERQLKKDRLQFTRLRTPGYGFRGVRYPGDFVLWFPNTTYLVECKERKKLPLAPSDIRQLPFMQSWESAENCPNARYIILVSADDKYYIFTSKDAVTAGEVHKGLRETQSICTADNLKEIIKYLKETIW